MKVKYLNTAKKSIKAMDHQNRTRGGKGSGDAAGGRYSAHVL